MTPRYGTTTSTACFLYNYTSYVICNVYIRCLLCINYNANIYIAIFKHGYGSAQNYLLYLIVLTFIIYSLVCSVLIRYSQLTYVGSDTVRQVFLSLICIAFA